ncbi:hypothetical protein K438DRAFT_1868752 [Mycena galopus ATCC 62051]|nr:hypothetical protein K438DRAFT_1868752 [Mycena galopus ATCC 62051]
MGKPCRGGPIPRPKPQGPSRGHQLFVGCSGWTSKFQKGTERTPSPITSMKTFSPRVWRGCRWPTISARILHLAAGSFTRILDSKRSCAVHITTILNCTVQP